ncbi:MAG TPA: adenylyltransferase/cytidyltransferase family protein [Verrucomicrobiae bacterium]|nr:adenylyltransferase/cytidyltransferase family protein [Verrucomicrobiae bacterium]
MAEENPENPKKTLVYVGRLSPIHLGHERVIETMRQEADDKDILVVIGSCNQERSFRHFFSYLERRELLLTLYPNIRVVGLPDFPTDEEWLTALDDILKLDKATPQQSLFYGGCDEDILFFRQAGRNCKIINRFDGSSVKVSATEVRDALIHERSLDGMVNPVLHDKLLKMFGKNWEEFRRR